MKHGLFCFVLFTKKKTWTAEAKKYDNKSISHKQHQSRGNADPDTCLYQASVTVQRVGVTRPKHAKENRGLSQYVIHSKHKAY